MPETETITAAEFLAQLGSGNKYGAKKVVIDGITFDSQAEGERYTQLKLLEQAGEIRELKLQPRYLLQAAFIDSDGVRHNKIEYVADFAYTECTGAAVCEDFKGVRTAVFDLKWKLVKKLFPTISFRLVQAERRAA